MKKEKEIRLIKTGNTYVIEVFRKGLFCKGRWINPCISEINGDRPKDMEDFAILEFNDIEEANFVYDFLLKNKYLDDDCIRIISGESLEDINRKVEQKDEILRCD